MIHIGWKKILVAVLLMSGVSCIDEDLSDCGKNYVIRYDVRLQANLQTLLEAELDTLKEEKLGQELKKALSKVFSDKAHDLDLTFYGDDSTLVHEEKHIVDKNEASYTIYLPVQDYQHLAMANALEEKNVLQEKAWRAHPQTLAWEQKYTNPTGAAGYQDTLDSYENGLFTARLNMEVKDTTQQFFVNMYMQNAAMVLIVNPNGVPYKSISGVVTHLADRFDICDSLYHYRNRTAIRTKQLENTGSDLVCLYGVGFPSPDDPFDYQLRTRRSAEEGESITDTYWVFHVDVTLPAKSPETKAEDAEVQEDKVVHNVLCVKKRLKAGDLRILRVALTPEGEITTNSMEAGVGVELDWKEGGEFNPEI